ncbi:MAG: site-2 protease family protein [Candidatus Thermoplasmatota archaeon]|nr:site-2 protease family protein [Candidatus Thermoplasmatota archaeon]
MNGLEIAIFAIFLWTISIMYLAPTISKTKHFAVYGPALMLKIVKNRKLLDRISKHFPGKFFGKISVIIVIMSAFVAMAMLIYGAYLSLSIKPANAPSLRLLIGLPGLNPAIPLGFGAAALIISVVIHEVFHGIVARNHGIKVNSVGALFFIIPVGAFVEPDEQEIQAADPVHRRRIIAAGPGINIVLALVSLLIISLLLVPSASPTHNGIYVEGVDVHSPASYLISTGTEVTSFGNYSGSQLGNLLFASNMEPGKLYNATIYDGKKLTPIQIPAGVVIDSVVKGLPADKANLSVGSVILSVNGVIIYNDTVLGNLLANTTPGANISVRTVAYSLNNTGKFSGIQHIYNVTTMSKFVYYSQYDPSANQNSYKNESFMGITLTYGGILGVPIEQMKSIVSGIEMFTNPWTGALVFISLPFASLYPVPSSLAGLFTVPLSPFIFWGTVNMFYWLFWINFLLGVTNALPLFVLDGGQFFRDSLHILGRRKMFSFLKNEKTMKRVMMLSNIIVLLLLFWQVIIPRII